MPTHAAPRNGIESMNRQSEITSEHKMESLYILKLFKFQFLLNESSYPDQSSMMYNTHALSQLTSINETKTIALHLRR